MEYVTPEVDVIGVGSELVQAHAGPHTDFGAFALSLLAVSSSFEEQ
jgi:hypothetical protein